MEETLLENKSKVENSESTSSDANSEPLLKNDTSSNLKSNEKKTSPQKIIPKILLNRGKSCDQIDKNVDEKILAQPLDNVAKTLNNDVNLQPSPTKEQLPSVVAGRHRENLAFYTPRARSSILNDETVQKEMIKEGIFFI